MKSILAGAGVLASAIALGLTGAAAAAPGGGATLHLPCSVLNAGATGGSLVLQLKSGVVTVTCINKHGTSLSGTIECTEFQEAANEAGLDFTITGGTVTVLPSDVVHGKCTVVAGQGG